MSRRRRALAVAVLSGLLISIIVLMLLVIKSSGKEQDTTTEQPTDKTTESTEAPQPKAGRDYHFYYFDFEEKGRDTYFGPDAYAAATKAIKAKKATDVIDYVAGENGDLWTRIHKDPALCAGLAFYMDSEGATTGDTRLLEAEAGIEKPLDAIKAARDRFMATDADWTATEERIRAILTDKSTKIELKELSGYESAMYMATDPDDPEKAEVIVKPSSHEGGHFIIFTVKVGDKKIALKLRLECGYQAIEPKIPVPEPPPENHGKDINKSPQHREGADKEEFYDPEKDRKENNTEATSEPESPTTEYKKPDPPKEKVTEQPAAEPTTTDSGSVTVDRDNGSTEKVKTDDGSTETVKVTVGDGSDRDDLDKVADKVPDEVLPELKNDDNTTNAPASAIE